MEDETQPSHDDDENRKKSKLFAVHFAAVRFCFMSANEIPEIATSNGIPMPY